MFVGLLALQASTRPMIHNEHGVSGRALLGSGFMSLGLNWPIIKFILEQIYFVLE